MAAGSFDVTFLGHQGWQLSTGRTNVLLDPLLSDTFGHDPRGNDFDVFPPRRIDFERCPPIDAVLLSHEHEDHFHVPSLERLDRRIAIHLSARSSSAARRILRELGFTVHLVEPGEAFAIGELGVLPLPQESLEGSHPGEWDALSLYCCDRAGHGSFFTTVDHRPHAATFELLRSHRCRPAVLAYADNDSDASALFPWTARSGDGDESLADELRELLRRAIPASMTPEAILLCANGLAPRGELAWMNASIFHRDPRRACDRLRREHGDLFVAPMPGDTIRLVRGRRVSASASEWIGALPEDAWPARGRGAKAPAHFGPATGRVRIDEGERTALSAALSELARFLYGSSLFREMYRLSTDVTGGRRATFALVLLEGDDVGGSHASGGTVHVWHPSDCRFVAEPIARPEAELVAGVRCFASDLLAVLEATMPAASLTMGRLSGWNAAPSRLAFDVPNLLHTFCHPLRAPDRFLALYRALVRGEPQRVRSARD